MSGSCARQGVPPGGPEDVRPPGVIATFPRAFDTLRDLEAAVRFDFDERISERAAGGTLEDAVTISPKGGEHRVSHSRSSLSVTVEGGFRPGLVYRVTLQPVVADMFSNRLVEPFELIFTTGAEATPTTLAGQVWDRITGQGVSDLAVQAIGADSLVHQSVTDRQGIYAFRYLPGGAFTVTAFEDQNRDGVVDSTETQGARPAEMSVGDTLLLDIPVLGQDTLPAFLTDTEVVDSLTIVLEFDDFLEPSIDAGSVGVLLGREEGAAPVVESVYHEADYSAFVLAVTDSFARLDSLEREEAALLARIAGQQDTLQLPDSAVVDTLPAPDSAAAPPLPEVQPTIGAEPQPQGPIGRIPPAALSPAAGNRPGPVEGMDRVLPGRRLVAVLTDPIERDVLYTVTVTSVVNINGVTGGGGDATFQLASPDTATADTLAVPDTGVAQPDTGSAGPLSPRDLFRRRR